MASHQHGIPSAMRLAPAISVPPHRLGVCAHRVSSVHCHFLTAGFGEHFFEPIFVRACCRRVSLFALASTPAAHRPSQRRVASCPSQRSRQRTRVSADRNALVWALAGHHPAASHFRLLHMTNSARRFARPASPAHRAQRAGLSGSRAIVCSTPPSPLPAKGPQQRANGERRVRHCSSALHIAAPTGSLASAKSMTLHPVSPSPFSTPCRGHAESRRQRGSSAPSSLRSP